VLITLPNRAPKCAASEGDGHRFPVSGGADGHLPDSLLASRAPRARSSLRAHCLPQVIDERPLRAMDTDGVEITGQKGDDTMRKAPHARFDCVVRPTPPSACRPPHLAAPPAPRPHPSGRAARLHPHRFTPTRPRRQVHKMGKRCTDVTVCEKACDFCYCWVCDKPWKQCTTWKEHCICDGGVEWNLKRQKVPSATATLAAPHGRPAPHASCLPLHSRCLLASDAPSARLRPAQAPGRAGASAGAAPADGAAARHG
jgi:hypothetical protein